MKKTTHKKGFTIIELMLAIIVLGGMLTLTMTVIVGMLRFYVFANSVRKNQANGRDTLDLVTRDVRFGKLLIPDDSAPGPRSEICIYQKSEKKIIIYRYGNDPKNSSNPANTDLYRKEYRYLSNADPTTCDENNTDFINNLSAEPKISKMNLEKMYITKFDVTKTKGASFEVNSNAAATIINFGFLTGNFSRDSNGSLYCESSNIFCIKLGYITAINLRAGDE